MTDKRGIVVSTPVVATKDRLRLTTAPSDPQEVIFWLFWDELCLPSINLGP